MKITIDNKDMWLDFKSWQAQQEFMEYREFIYFKYFNLLGGPNKPVTEEDSFENWKLRGAPKPKLFDRA